MALTYDVMESRMGLSPDRDSDQFVSLVEPLDVGQMVCDQTTMIGSALMVVLSRRNCWGLQTGFLERRRLYSHADVRFSAISPLSRPIVRVAFRLHKI